VVWSFFGHPWPPPPPEKPDEEPEADLDPDGVGEWRYDRLIAAGWPEIYAAILALDRSIDLHQACDLLDRGCPLEKAWSILT